MFRQKNKIKRTIKGYGSAAIAEHEQYKNGALKRKRQVKQSGNILK
jgi:hypothetical protein